MQNRQTRIIYVLATLLCCMQLGACVALITPKVETQVLKLRAGEYKLDPAHSALLFKVQHLGLATYVGRFNKIAATLDFDPDNIQASKLEAIIDVDSLDINDPDLEKRLMGRAWFNQVKYPQASFTTLSVAPTSESEFDFTGELNWRGVSKALTIKVKFNGGANNILTQKYTLGFEATGSFLRSDFGMGDFVPIIGDEIRLEAFAEFQRS